MRLLSLAFIATLTGCTLGTEKSGPSTTSFDSEVPNVGALRPFVVEQPAALSASFDDDLHTLLQSAAEARDADLLAMVDPDITVSFGVENGHAAFVDMWKDANSPNPWGRFLDAMDIVLRDGGARTSNGDIQFPHHSVVLRDDVEIFSLGRVPKGTTARMGPSASSLELPLDDARTVLCEEIGCRATEGNWVAITSASGAKGYAPAKSMVSTIGQIRAVFEKQANGWTLVAFVRGD